MFCAPDRVTRQLECTGRTLLFQAPSRIHPHILLVSNFTPAKAKSAASVPWMTRRALP